VRISRVHDKEGGEMFLRIARWVPANGILFAALVIIATLVTGSSPDTDSSDATWTSYYADAGNRHQEEISFFLVGLAGLCFLQFLGSLRGALARAEGEPARITTAAVASGAAFITIAISAHAVQTVTSWTVSASDHFTVDPNTARLLSSLSYVLFVMSLFAASAMAIAVATLAFVTPAFPAWLAWFSALAAVAGVLGILFFPSLVVLAWIVALSAYLLLPRTGPEAAVTPV
jgi:hypothetical protein